MQYIMFAALRNRLSLFNRCLIARFFLWTIPVTEIDSGYNEVSPQIIESKCIILISP